MDTISIQTARNIQLAAQGLDSLKEQPTTKADVLEAVRRMGALQIDTIHVVARSPYLVLWSHLGDYHPEWLDELLAEGALFEYWSHAMCFLPVEDYPLYRRRMLEMAVDGNWTVKWTANHTDVVERVLTRIRSHGAVRSVDFENTNHRSSGWWDWKEEKQALEVLLTMGEIMIARRQKFQRVYDLRERILPGWNDMQTPPVEEVRRRLILKAVRALGVALPTWVPDYFRLPRKNINGNLEALAEEGSLVRVGVEGLHEIAYIHPDQIDLFEEVASGRRVPSLTTLLSPFDPLVWDRKRAHELFNFDYSIECYLPAPKRHFGYFNLPILHRGALVGRLDPKAHRTDGVFEVKALYLEPGILVDDDLVSSLSQALRRLAEWHATPQVIIRRSEPVELAERVIADFIHAE
jgi:uncharacterized protein YcaQ